MEGLLLKGCVGDEVVNLGRALFILDFRSFLSDEIAVEWTSVCLLEQMRLFLQLLCLPMMMCWSFVS